MPEADFAGSVARKVAQNLRARGNVQPQEARSQLHATPCPYTGPNRHGAMSKSGGFVLAGMHILEERALRQREEPQISGRRKMRESGSPFGLLSETPVPRRAPVPPIM
jgi:hypothetical protein